jgi:tRNA-dihydrouridine synthase B
MVASEELVRERRDVVARAQGKGLSNRSSCNWLAATRIGCAKGARLACEAGADIIDINMGCPSRQVTGGLSGSALMRDEALAADIIAATLRGQSPTRDFKMRLGLGSPKPECATTGADSRSISGLADDYRTWPHALPVL